VGQVMICRTASVSSNSELFEPIIAEENIFDMLAAFCDDDRSAVGVALAA
jgi:hypothetical protein